ncbi:protein TPX2-like isoform X2 [Vicia villosa]|uniref:protein TPX2-like isoform X2 n=1 Tax=Vicia villosa TaxID=3911 RepID=UPI00273AA974|nr:protein TPX2-like isoform X2 [Vicia villosa]
MESNAGVWKQAMEIENEGFGEDEIDMCYEFDAARFFDFTAQETLVQSLQAERWFDTATTYDHSPVVANLLMREEVPVTNTITTVHHPKPNFLQHFGMTFNSKKIGEGLNSKAKSVVMKGLSTLMKPTASQLAKQNRPLQFVGSRFKKVQAHKKEINLANTTVIESQAAKRQKLDGGLLRKVGDVKQQANFVHKAPKKIVTTDQNSGHSKLNVHTSQRIRPKNGAEAELMTRAVPKFKARPLNRKILDAPSLPIPKRTPVRLPEFQEFHLKTSERAVQHKSFTSSSTLPCKDSDQDSDKHATASAPQNRIWNLRRPSVMAAPKNSVLDSGHEFKARPFNKKILSSKGDIGVFRNIKQEATVPMEFNFLTEKRLQHNPPTDLFSKLSLRSGDKPTMFRKDSKENMGTNFHLAQKVKPLIFGEKQIHSGSEGYNSGTSTVLNELGNAVTDSKFATKTRHFC